MKVDYTDQNSLRAFKAIGKEVYQKMIMRSMQGPFVRRCEHKGLLLEDVVLDVETFSIDSFTHEGHVFLYYFDAKHTLTKIIVSGNDPDDLVIRIILRYS